MAVSESEILAALNECLPPALTDLWMDQLVQSNQMALLHCQKMGVVGAERRDVFGTLQRAIFEGLWRRAIPAEFPHVKGRLRKNKQRTSSYTTMHVGRFVITQSSVNGTKLPRLAHFRNVLAQTSQLSLWDDAIPDPKSLIYAILLHGHSRDYSLNSAKIVIPDKSCESPLATLSLTAALIAAMARADERLATTHRPDAQPANDSTKPADSPLPPENVPEPAAPLLRAKKKREGEK
jgi:hypothetical protein